MGACFLRGASAECNSSKKKSLKAALLQSPRGRAISLLRLVHLTLITGGGCHDFLHAVIFRVRIMGTLLWPSLR